MEFGVLHTPQMSQRKTLSEDRGAGTNSNDRCLINCLKLVYYIATVYKRSGVSGLVSATDANVRIIGVIVACPFLCHN